MDGVLAVEDRLHDDEVDLLAHVRHLDAVHAVEARDEGPRVHHDVLVVVREDPAQELALGLALRLDHELSGVGVEVEGA